MSSTLRRQTLSDLLRRSGLRVAGGTARLGNEAAPDDYLAALRALAQAGGVDPDAAIKDALPVHYLVVAVAQ